MFYTEKINQALNLCYQANEGTYDMGGTPYVFHVFYVASGMETEQEICTALLMESAGVHASYSELAQMGFDEQILEACRLLHRPKSMDYFSFIRRLRSNPLASRVMKALLEHDLVSGRMALEGSAARKSQMRTSRAIELLCEGSATV